MAENAEPIMADDPKETPSTEKPKEEAVGTAVAPAANEVEMIETTEEVTVTSTTLTVEAGGRFQALLRSTFAARVTGASEALSGDLSHVPDRGMSLRGAYLSRLSGVAASSAGGGITGSNALRDAYVAQASASATEAAPAKAGRRAAAKKAPAKKRAVAKKAVKRTAKKATAKPAAKKRATEKGTAAKKAGPKKAKKAAKASVSGRRPVPATRAAPKTSAKKRPVAKARASKAKGRRR
jgi:hypothetical protein